MYILMGAGILRVFSSTSDKIDIICFTSQANQTSAKFL
jgi:hypothetical protein